MPFSAYARKTMSFFEYDTRRYVHINSRKIGIFRRLIQLIIISYIVGYVLVYNKGYQDTCFVESSVVTKVKGVTFTNFSEQELNENNNLDWYQRVWDQSDYVFPPSANENGGFFIMTNIIITPNQTRGKCPEDPNIDRATCTSHTNCQHQFAPLVGNGVQTGKCIPNDLHNIKTCEIFAWCPVEQRSALPGKRPLLAAAENFTILIKNGIAFPKFGKEYQRRNILEDASSTYLKNCTYHPQTNQFCPVFRIGDIITQAGESFHKIGIKGAVFRISIKWNCNLDWDFLKYCHPEYKFQRMDSPNAQIAPGFNFRLSRYHEENRRTLVKMFGIKFLIEVKGKARKFSLFPLLLNVGSGLALMGLVTIVCDLLVLYCLKSKKIYKEKKYLNVKGKDDAFNVNPTRNANNTECNGLTD